MKIFYAALLACLLLSCTHIETGASLSANDLTFIRSLGLLNQGETIHQFYSNIELRKAGSFFTDKRMAHYWIYGNDSSQHQREYAFYPDITAIDTVFTVPDFDCPYLQVHRKDRTAFRVYLDGSREEMQLFYREVHSIWSQRRHDAR